MITNPLLQSLLTFAKDITARLQDAKAQLWSLEGDWYQQTEYELHASVFNRRFHKKPWFIVYCRSEAEVQATFELAIANNLPIRIRAGGHDHEAECTGNDSVLIDVSEMTRVEVDPDSLIAHIGPGNRFKKLTTDLANAEVMLPHGTCATVGITGFVMGGGWGPWTRKYGMCCERLVGANLVLGDGRIVKLNGTDTDVPDLLWALRGGGGFSYGLATELRIQTFKLPKTLIRFCITWNPWPDQPDRLVDYPNEDEHTIDVLKAWENAICSPETPELIGTNLRVSGRPNPADTPVDPDSVYNNCVMFGYWEGTRAALEAWVPEWFGSVPIYRLEINDDQGGTGNDKPYGDMLMSSWAREDTNHVLATQLRAGREIELSDEHARLLAEGKPLPPDFEQPAPHKITSRLVDAQGLGPGGYAAYLQSLCSPLILEGNRNLGLSTYTTLGAIVGDYYRNNPSGGNSAFPYKDKLYTIQYQTWWNSELFEMLAGQNNPVNDRTNRALDWMERARDYDIPNTSGSFISFKDASIPTETYFAQNYQKLVEIKQRCSNDPLNHFRSRKTII